MKKLLDKKGFSLIELMVAMAVFALLMGGMVAVSVAGFKSYGKSKAIKVVTEDVGFAINSITKDVRMGKIESIDKPVSSATTSDKLIVTRNSSLSIVQYQITNKKMTVCDCSEKTCSSTSGCADLVDLSSTDMSFDSTSGFRNQRTAPIPNPTIRGWAEINMNIESPTMDTDTIHIQSIVSSRDYGWEETP